MITKYTVLFFCLLLLVCLAYVPGLSGPILFDSHIALIANSLASPDPSVFDSWRIAAQSSDSGMLGRSLPMLSFAAQHALVGDWHEVHLKSVNLIIHLVIGIVLYRVFVLLIANSTLGGDIKKSASHIAFLAASLWLAHPLFVSTILYSVQRMAQLSTLFLVLGIYVYCVYRNRWFQRRPFLGEIVALALWQSVILILALNSKENGILLPWLLITVEVCFFRGVVCGYDQKRLSLLAWFLFFLPVIVFFSAYFFLGDWFELQYKYRDFTLVQRLMTELRVLWSYIYWALVPNISSMGLHHDDFMISRGWRLPDATIVALVFWLFTIVLCLLWRKRNPVFCFAVIFYLVGHSLESSIFGLELVYEHRNYLPMIGVFLWIAYLIIIGSKMLPKKYYFVPAVVVLSVLLVLTSFRSSRWSDEYKMAAVNVHYHPESMRSHDQYVDVLLNIVKQSKNDTPIAVIHEIRRHIQIMMELDSKSLVPPVKLLLINSAYPTIEGNAASAVDTIKTAATKTILLPQDINALLLLVECAGIGLCDIEMNALLVVLEGLRLRFPSNASLLMLQAQLLSYDQSNYEAIVNYWKQASNLDRRSTKWSYIIAQSHIYQKEYGKASLVLTDLMGRDTKRRELPRIKKLFEMPR